MSIKSFQYRIQPAVILDLGDGVVMPFQYIPPGSFWMGSRVDYPDEEPQHFVNITRPFYLGTIVVTQEQFAYSMGARKNYRGEEPRHFVTITQPFYLGTFPITQEQFARWKPEHENCFPNRPDHPAEQISWGDAVDYCGWLKRICAVQIPADLDVGLPSEAQWEYACRAGTDTEYYSGDGDAALATAGWYDGNSNSETQPVGQLKENDFGLFDMHGNVMEWCADAWDEAAYKKRVNDVRDPFVVGDDDADRVVRGGCWFDSPWDCRAACRFRWRPGIRGRGRGFRVCLFLGPFSGQTGRAEQTSVGQATRNEEAKPQRDREASEFFEDFDEARFPSR